MTVLTSTYYGFTRVRQQSPDANDWAVTDSNFENLSKVLKALEQHRHTGVAGPQYPGYYVSPSAPVIATVGTAGTDNYSYYIVAKGPINMVSDTGTISTGNATLDATNYNTVTWAAVTGATSYDVIRLTGGATQGILANVAGTTYNDQGTAATPYTPVGQPDIIINDPAVKPGILAPGTSIGVRLAYVNAAGLETQASPERIFLLQDIGVPPLAPIIPPEDIGVTSPGIPGGNYFYVMTKVKGTGETLISEVTNVSLPYNRTSSVTLQFDPINAYTDGTEAYKIYRANGFNEAFQLVATVTSTSATTYVDNNTIEDPNGQPPTTSTFGSNQSINISWANITHPGSVTGLKVYVTQQSGIWTTSHLLHTEPIVLGTAVNTSYDYIGNESLDSGAPKESSQIPDDAPTLNAGADVLIPLITDNTLPISEADGYTAFWQPIANPQQMSLQRYDSAHGWQGMSSPVGVIDAYAGSAAPSGWLLCQGQVLNSSTNPEYAALYAVIGTAYGGTGATDFHLPDLQGRVPMGVSGSHARGASGGAETHTLTYDELPTDTALWSGGLFFASMEQGTGGSAGYIDMRSGGGGSHNNLQPYQTVNYIIKY